MIVNVTNPYYDPHKYSAYLPECRYCGCKPCKNCPLIVDKEKTLRSLLDQLVKQPQEKKFKDNAYLFMNKHELKEMNERDSSEEEDSGSDEKMVFDGSTG